MLLLALALCALPHGVDGADLDDEDPQPDLAEKEAVADRPLDAGFLYTADLSDEELERLFVEDLPSLGSVSMGLAEAGRLINGVQVHSSAHLEVVAPEHAWGTAETVEYLEAVADEVAKVAPAAARLRVNHLGKREGGYLRPHFSHQSGRDVDLGFYYLPGTDVAHLSGSRLQSIDLAASWALVKALAAKADVQVVLLDRKVQAALAEYARGLGEDPQLLDALFKGPSSLFQHARRHKDHFHVRFYAPRSQELGRRVQPLLARRPDENKLLHRVKAGETLGHIAARYGSTVKLIQKASGLANTLLSIGRTLVVPLRGPCTQCPVTAPLVVPPRLLTAEAPPSAPEPSPPSAAQGGSP